MTKMTKQERTTQRNIEETQMPDYKPQVEGKHTALPWKYVTTSMKGQVLLQGGKEHYQDDGFSVQLSEANAAFIVKACNSHYELINELKLARMALTSGDCITQTVKGIDEALAKAGA